MNIRNELPDDLREEAAQKGLRRLRRYKYAVLQLYLRRIGRERIIDFLVENGCSPNMARWVLAEALKEDLEEWPSEEEEAFKTAQKELEEKPLGEVMARLSLAGAVMFFTYVLLALFWQNFDSSPGMLILLPVFLLVLLGAAVYFIWGTNDLVDRFLDWKRRRGLRDEA